MRLGHPHLKVMIVCQAIRRDDVVCQNDFEFTSPGYSFSLVEIPILGDFRNIVIFKHKQNHRNSMFQTSNCESYFEVNSNPLGL